MDEWQKIIPPQELERLVKTGDRVGIYVLVGDIRNSTFLMKNRFHQASCADNPEFYEGC